VSNVTAATPPVPGSVYLLEHSFDPKPLGNDLFYTMGDNSAIPIVGTFDPPLPAPPAPQVTSIPNQTMDDDQTTLQIPVTVKDGALQSLSVQATATGYNQAYDLKEQLGLYYTGNYSFDAHGADEKMIAGKGGLRYIILPDGELRKWLGSLTATLAASSSLIATDPLFYVNPSTLWNAKPPAAPPGVTATFQNGVVTVTRTSFTGTFQVNVIASDRDGTTTESFLVTVPNQTPTLSVANVTRCTASR